jgi:uroporphyrinogen decarboxylase
MDSCERVTRVLRKQLPDRVPVGLHSYLMNCQMHGGRFDEILRDGQLMAEAQLNGWRTFGHDLLMLEIGVCAEAEALGCSIRYSPDGPPHVAEPLIKQPADLDKLRVPDPERTFPLTEMLKATRIVKRETGGRVFINGRSDQGPIALALALCGPERFLTMLMDAEWQAWCRRLVEICSQVNVALGEAQRRAGADSSTIGLAGTSLISPALFDAFELPGARAFCSAMQRAGGFAFAHACGNETHLLGNLLATGADCLELDPGTDPATCKRATQGRATVLGMIDPAQVMRFGTPDDVRQETIKMLATMGPGGGFIAGPGCALPADTPPENVHALIECVQRHGVYAADGRLAVVPTPQRSAVPHKNHNTV